MIDSLLSLTFSFVNSKGSYALLLGSGISRPAGIPTGWEIVLDLIQNIAHLNNEKIETSPEEWYAKKFNKAPNYSELLNDILKTSSERNNFLKQYFEPSEEEKEQGLKVPTKAHIAIAKLVKAGYIKIIVTTNFDRLLEIALEKENMIPNVISTVDNLKGSLPIIHSKCTVVKINGDYLDTRIRNTESELEEYDKEFNQLLDRIFDEFGLLVCGWSSDWDIGLRKAIERCKSRRFTTYWISKDGITSTAQKLVDLLSAELITNTTADKFFPELLEKTLSVVELEKQHPISSKIAIATSKKYLSDSKYNINLHDLIISETKKVIDGLSATSLSAQGSFTKEEFLRRVSIYESKIEILLNIVITISYWGNSSQFSYVTKCIESIVNSNSLVGGVDAYINQKKYPSLLLMYAAGISALANNRYDLVKTLLVDTMATYQNQPRPLINRILTFTVINKDLAALLPGRTAQNYTPFSDYLNTLLHPYFSPYILDKNSFDILFDKFEYLISLIYADIVDQSARFWVPFGSFTWRTQRYFSENAISIIYDKELIKLKSDHPILKVGLFNNSLERLLEIKKKVDEFVANLNFY